MEPRPSPLARYLAIAYGLIVIYASLHPLSGWRDQGLSPFAFLAAPLPPYITAFDVAANLLAYLPLGALVVLALFPGVRGLIAGIVATLLGAMLSMTLESLQSFLPDRIPSNLDLALNTAGAAAGAVIGLVALRALLERGAAHALRDRLFLHGGHIDLGLVLIALWLATQLYPETLLFGNGDLRDLFESAPAVLYPAATFVRIEGAVTGANVVAIALLLALLVADGAPKRWLFLLLVAGACLVRTLAFALLLLPQGAFAWATPGALLGLAAGTIVALAALSLPRAAAVAVCGVLLMAATALVNLAPDNPYLLHSLQAWRRGHFLNFNGLTRIVSTLWPLAALAYLLVFATRERGAQTR